MNERSKSVSFRRRIYWYVAITAVIQFLLGVGFGATIFTPGPLFLFFLVLMANFPYLLQMQFQHSLNYAQFPVLIVAGTFFMFLIVLGFGEIHHRITEMIPSDPLEEAKR